MLGQARRTARWALRGRLDCRLGRLPWLEHVQPIAHPGTLERIFDPASSFLVMEPPLEVGGIDTLDVQRRGDLGTLLAVLSV